MSQAELQPSAVEVELAPAPVSWPFKRDLLGVQVTPTTYDEAVDVILAAARHREGGAVSCQAVHAVVTASCDKELRQMVNSFEMITPDGQPVRWGLNLLYKTGLTERVYGPELTLRLCRAAAEQGVSVYLYGGSPEVVEMLAANLGELCPDLEIAGYESPPFRKLTDAEDAEMVERVNASGAGLMFIGLGCPKQDYFAFDHRQQIAAVQLCVGAAFDFHAGAKPMAPLWMQRRGLEWAYRLWQEPRRLWKRYLVTNTIYVQRLFRQWLRLKLGFRPRMSAKESRLTT